MKIPFLKIFKSQSKSIPEEVSKQLQISFPNAKNIDWEIKGEIFEAIFYLNDIEHIAKISQNGNLIEYKKNLWIEELPESVKIGGNSLGEIMNVIVIYVGSEKFYELIVRNEKLDRFEYLFNEHGVVLKSKNL
jgi:hypothetical protein